MRHWMSRTSSGALSTTTQSASLTEAKSQLSRGDLRRLRTRIVTSGGSYPGSMETAQRSFSIGTKHSSDLKGGLLSSRRKMKQKRVSQRRQQEKRRVPTQGRAPLTFTVNTIFFDEVQQKTVFL